MTKLREKPFILDWANCRERDKSVWFSVRNHSRTRSSFSKNSIECLQCRLIQFEDRLQSTLWRRPHSSQPKITSQRQPLTHLEQPQPPSWTAPSWKMSHKLLLRSLSQLQCFWLKNLSSLLPEEESPELAKKVAFKAWAYPHLSYDRKTRKTTYITVLKADEYNQLTLVNGNLCHYYEHFCLAKVWSKWYNRNRYLRKLIYTS